MISADSLFNQYRGKRLLLDTNLLLLCLIGTFDRSLISRFKRTAGSSAGDFDILANLLPFFRHLVTTPQILTEVASLANALPEPVKPLWHLHLRQHTSGVLEILRPILELMQQPGFLSFGLGDASIVSAAVDTLILTDDFRLSGYLRSRKLPVLNFRDLLELSGKPFVGRT